MNLSFCKLNDKLREESKKLLAIEEMLYFYARDYAFDHDLEDLDDKDLLPMFTINLLDDGDTVQIIVEDTNTTFTDSIKDWNNS